MNSETGRMMTWEEMESQKQLEQAKSIPIDMQFATLKQRQEMQVSKHDNRTSLGKLRFKTF